MNVPSPPAGSAPAEPRDVAALRRLRTSDPDLAPAIDFQLAWLQTERRVDSRVPLPRTVGADALCAARLAAGARVLEFDDLVLDWSDVRRLCGQAADLLRRADFLEPDVEARALACLRDARALPIELRRWFDRDRDGRCRRGAGLDVRPAALPHPRGGGAAAATARRRLAASGLSRLRRRRRVRGVERRRSPARLRSLRRAVAVRSGALSALPRRRRSLAAELLRSEPRLSRRSLHAVPALREGPRRRARRPHRPRRLRSDRDDPPRRGRGSARLRVAAPVDAARALQNVKPAARHHAERALHVDGRLERRAARHSTMPIGDAGLDARSRCGARSTL